MQSLWTTQQAAKFLGLKAHTLEKWRTTGDGPPWLSVGGARRYRPSEVEVWLDSQARRSTSEIGTGDLK
jgi:DNA-binding transcriptional MerR regulator